MVSNIQDVWCFHYFIGTYKVFIFCTGKLSFTECEIKLLSHALLIISFMLAAWFDVTNSRNYSLLFIQCLLYTFWLVICRNKQNISYHCPSIACKRWLLRLLWYCFNMAEISWWTAHHLMLHSYVDTFLIIAILLRFPDSKITSSQI